MATKILIKRGTATQWTNSTTALLAGELGLDTTNNIVKVGNGTTLWNSLPGLTLTSTQVSELAQDAIKAALDAGTHNNITVNFDDAANSLSLSAGPDLVTTTSLNNTLTNSTTGYVPIADVGQPDGVASLDSNGKIPDSQIPTEIARSADIAEAAQDAVGGLVGNGLDYDDSTGAISVDPSEFTLNAIGTPTADISMATYKITNLGSPTSANDAANKSYVDNTTAGLNFHAAVHAATTANLDATYNNGTSGVGATLTATSNGALVVDGHTLNASERVLIKNQTTGAQNGLYVVTATGDASNPFILTRATDADNSPAGEVAYGDFVFVQNGTSNGGYGYIVNTTGTITLGTTAISYVQFNAGQTVIAGYGLTESSPGTFAVDTSVIQAKVTGVDDTEIGYLNGVTSAIQSQINSKLNSSDFTYSTITIPVYNTVAELPAASSNHGRWAHVHGEGAMYFAHGGAWYRSLSQEDLYVKRNAQTASYTLVLSDVSKLVEISVGSSNTLTIPTNASVAFPIGTQIIVVQTGLGQTTISGASGVTLNATPSAGTNLAKIRSQWSSVTLIKRDTDTWIAVGDLVA